MSVLHGFARLDMYQCDLVFFHPANHSPRGELRTIVGAQALRCSTLGNQSLQHVDHPPAAQAGRWPIQAPFWLEWAALSLDKVFPQLVRGFVPSILIRSRPFPHCHLPGAPGLAPFETRAKAQRGKTVGWRNFSLSTSHSFTRTSPLSSQAARDQAVSNSIFFRWEDKSKSPPNQRKVGWGTL